MAKHVVVIGAGIVGLCAADALLRRGFAVTVLEREAAPGDGCSFGNGGLVVPSHFAPLAAPGMVATGLRMLTSRESPFGFAEWPNWRTLRWMLRFALAGTHRHVARAGPVLRDLNLASRSLYETQYRDVTAGYERRGELMVCLTSASLEAEKHVADAAQKLGLHTEVLSRDELSRFESGIETDAEGAIYFVDDAHLTPARFMNGLRARVRSAGATLRYGASVSDVRQSTSDGIHLTLGEETLPCDAVVIAAGSWSGELAQLFGFELALLAGKGYGFTVPNPPATPRFPAILVDGRVAVTPMQDGLRFVGTMELGPTSNTHQNPHRIQGMRNSIARAYPAFRAFDFSPLPVWTGLRPCPPDGMPYLGRSRRNPNVVVATGHGMMGMSLGPISGEIVAQIINQEPTSCDLTLLSPDRYART